jgi:hypothetical protein
MTRTVLSGILFGLLVTSISGVLSASEADELRERVKSPDQKAAAPAEKGDREKQPSAGGVRGTATPRMLLHGSRRSTDGRF